MPITALSRGEQYAAHLIQPPATATALSEYDFGFQPIDYSRLKYGSKSLARRYGRELANSLLDSEQFESFLPSLANPKGVVIYPAPFNFVPTATYALKDYFVARYNEVAIPRHGLAPLQEGKVFRSYSYNEDYGAMSKAQRDKAISGDDFYIDTEFARGKTLIFLDDIRVTGSHEERIRHLLERTGLVEQPHLFLYFANQIPVALAYREEIIDNIHFHGPWNDGIPELAAKHQVEGRRLERFNHETRHIKLEV